MGIVYRGNAQHPLHMHADESAASTEPASTPEESDDIKTSATFPIVGVGASAGGLDALKLLLHASQGGQILKHHQQCGSLLLERRHRQAQHSAAP